MTVKLPTTTKQYLVFMIENKISNNPQDSVFKDKNLYNESYNPVDWWNTGVEKVKEIGKKIKDTLLMDTPEDIAKQEEQKKKSNKNLEKNLGGFGTGGAGGKGKTTGPNPLKTILGDNQEIEGEEAEGNPLLDLLGVGGTVAAGAAAKKLSDIGADKLLGQFGGVGGKYAAKALSSLGGQLEDLSGKTWMETQLGKIGRSQLELAAQGAGSPWTPFEIPVRKGKDFSSPYDRETADLKSKLEAQRVRDAARQQGLIP